MKQTVALLLCVGLVLAVPGPRVADAANTLVRALDPVVVLGSAMPDFAGVPLAQFFVYKYSGGAWSQIPWQFDEVVGSAIVSSDNGLLDAQDQLVFMAADAGDQAPAHAWLADASAATFPRYELQVNDPLNATQHAWVYVYRSQTLISTISNDYVTYDGTQALLTSDRYKLGQMTDHPAFNRLELNGSGVDILDRTKIRVLFLFTPNTEEDLAATPPDLTRAGHVRVVLNGGGILAYRAFYVNKIHVDLSPYLPLKPQWGRFSADMSSLASGSLYYDPNVPAGVVINGAADSVPLSPAADWSQVSGATGTVIRAIDFSGAGGTSETFYRDNVTPESPDTGETGSYGDAGVKITKPTATVFDFWSWNYILPANQPNVGATYRGYARNPLQVQATENLVAPVVTIGIPTGTTNVKLTWGAVGGATLYRVWWHSTDPYFTSGGTLVTDDPDPSDLTYTHAGAAANPANYYYVVRAANANPAESADANRTGKFTFVLVPGTG
jgi:hypothetical protein